MSLEKIDSALLRYIVANGFKPGDRLPCLDDLSTALKISVGKLREQLEVARSMGLVDVRTRSGIKLEEYTFLPAVRFSVLYALALDPAQFDAFNVLRNRVEAAFWYDAVARLMPEDHTHLRDLLRNAWAKLNGHPIRIPHTEHRDLHLTIYGRLQNPFVKGLLEAYWEAYEAVGLSVFSDYAYLREVWTYHERIVDALEAGNLDEGYRLLVQHTALLRNREAAHPLSQSELAQPVGEHGLFADIS
jgi:DNA-binding FadR family transcriptional regulator